ncbi:tRNA (guanine(46)-N(7))-methyltransferase [hydrothermal vent metagenome]|uniref:tRNA (guanine(46)-N(7))-methyltransferase n=1 Tax=hydrothermal vent metagenome TaxID=652676 RepID=A0A3B0TBS3_9ZZZZ
MTEASDHPRRKLIYGRRQGHRLRGRQARLMETLLPRLMVPAAARGQLDPQHLFPTRSGESGKTIRLEIGFGGGEHLLARAAASPQTGFIGAEPFVNGVAKLLAGIDGQGLENIRIHADDARDLIAWLAPASIAHVDVLYPDPWPKTRHHKRRLVCPATIAELARIMRSGAKLIFASDIADYVGWTEALMAASPAFKPTGSDCRQPPKDWPSTRYEKKALAAGRVPTYLTFRRL